MLIDIFQYSSSSLDTLAKNLGKEDFKCFSHKVYRKVFDLVKHEGFCPYEYMSSFEKFKEEFPSKQRLYIR